MKEEGFATAVQPDIQETSAPVVPKVRTARHVLCTLGPAQQYDG